MHHGKFSYCILLMALVTLPRVYAVEGKFVTIIGPDGMPLLIENPAAKERSHKKQTGLQKKQQAQPEVTLESKVDSIQQDKSGQPLPVSSVASNTTTSLLKHQSVVSSARDDSVAEPNIHHTASLSPPIVQLEKKVEHKQATTAPVAISKQDITQPGLKLQSAENNEEKIPYTVIDGEKYYAAEVLESYDYSLDNKQKFFSIPLPNTAGQAGIWTNFDKNEVKQSSTELATAKTKQVVAESIELADHYTVLSQQQLQQILPLQCVDKKAQNKAKQWKKNSSISLWPSKPFEQDDFSYQLVELHAVVENFRLYSYASSNQQPSFYWPIVIFLDSKGCVLEAATGFYTKSHAATLLQNSALMGTIHVPERTKFLMFSALEHSADIPDTKLSNEGQLELVNLK